MRADSTGPVWLVALVALVSLLGVWFSGQGSLGRDALVVYCAHDAVYSEEILREFERQTGIPVVVRFDTEATKSLGLIELIKQEQAHPQCDVLWNNELLGTLELQAAGLLESYRGTGWERLPETFRDPEGHWLGFGARLRVWIVNTQQMTADLGAIEELLQVETSRVAMAKPMFGTTLTHYCVLADRWGLPKLQEWHHRLRQQGLREVAGNGLSKDLVAAGSCDCGWTDTDDAFLAIDAGKPVTQLPATVDGQPIVIPNTVAIIRGTKRQPNAEKLIDYLASAETELRLARSRARQIPLGPVDEHSLPPEVRQIREWTANAIDLRQLLPVRREVLNWLRSEYAP